MIAVIADDLTGAAELGGIGLRHRLMTAVTTTVKPLTGTPSVEMNPLVGVDLLVIAADTRSMGEVAAMHEMERIMRELKLLQPEWIYKKVDSVLRGHVVAELNAQLKVLDWERALLVPANPLLGRTIVDGHYYLKGLPVDQSSFSEDPEFPIRDSAIREMLHASVAIRNVSQELPATGIVVGEVRHQADLQAWAGRIAQKSDRLAQRSGRIAQGMLLAGASGFFSAILDTLNVNGSHVVQPRPFGQPALFVSGTSFGSNRDLVREWYAAGGPVSYMPAGGDPAPDDSASDDSAPDHRWCGEVIAMLASRGKAVMAIDATAPGTSASSLRVRMAAAVRQVLDQVKVAELIIEGGATAYAILQQAGLDLFYPEEELAPGVIRMRAAGTSRPPAASRVPGPSDLYITVKPGSYRWPESINFQH
jgi:uncharacterized protein YgbK (DUF1537 family)